MDPSESPLLDMDADGIAAALRAEALLGGPDALDHDPDPVLHALWAGTKDYFFGCCGQLAVDLSVKTGRPVIVLECRREGFDGWILRHAAVAEMDWVEAKAMCDRGDGFAIPLVDAVGTGTFDGRMDAFHLQDHEFRVVMAEDAKPDWMIAFEAIAKPLFDHDPATRMPGLASAFGKPFDARDAVSAILSEANERALSRIPDLDALRDWLAVPARVA